MTLKECYDNMGGDYKDAQSRLLTDERIAKFLNMLPKDTSFASLAEAMEKKDVKGAFLAAHTLKGVARNLSVKKLGDSADALTEALRGKEAYDAGAEPLFEKVKEDYDMTMKCIAELNA